MKTLNELKVALENQKKVWIESTTIWSDFSEDFGVGMCQHREAIEHDFLTENDQTDQFEPDNDDGQLMAEALEIRSEFLHDTIQALDLL